MSETQKTDWKSKELGAAWRNADKTSKVILSGYLNLTKFGGGDKVRFIAFKKDKVNKTTGEVIEKAPDLVFYLSEDRENPNAKPAVVTTKPLKVTKTVTKAKPAPVEVEEDAEPVEELL